MKLINQSTKNSVYTAWLKSELFNTRTKLTPNQIALIKNPDLDNPEENCQREAILAKEFDRKPIIESVPKEILWHQVEIEKKDVQNIYVLAYWDWFVDTGKTFRLSEVKNNLTAIHGKHSSNLPLGKIHKTKIDEMSHKVDSKIQDIIMISSSQKGPFTIIDGTHRSSLLAIRNQIAGTKAYLGIVKDLSKFSWSPEWSKYEDSLSDLNYLLNNGYFW